MGSGGVGGGGERRVSFERDRKDRLGERMAKFALLERCPNGSFSNLYLTAFQVQTSSIFPREKERRLAVVLVKNECGY